MSEYIDRCPTCGSRRPAGGALICPDRWHDESLDALHQQPKPATVTERGRSARQGV